MDDLLRDGLGLGHQPGELGWMQVSLRALAVFATAVVLVRLGARRFLARHTAFDIILAFTLGSTLSRAINGSAPLLPTITGALVLVLLHRMLAALAFRFPAVGSLLKGSHETLIRDGKVDPDALKRNYLSEQDLMEGLRLRSVDDPCRVKSAQLERNGDLSVIPRDSPPT